VVDLLKVLYVSDITGPPPYPTGSFDRVLLDAPCSALGQRPSCRNKMTLAEVKSYPALQRKIFTKVLSIVGIALTNSYISVAQRTVIFILSKLRITASGHNFGHLR